MADMTLGAIINFICQNKKKSEASAKNIFFKDTVTPNWRVSCVLKNGSQVPPTLGRFISYLHFPSCNDLLLQKQMNTLSTAAEMGEAKKCNNVTI
jgi:hypothetical protein